MSGMFRFLGLMCLIAAGGLVAIDLIIGIRQGPLAFRPLGKLWFDIHPESLQLLEPAVTRHLSQGLWTNVIQPVLEAPAALDFAALAVLFLALGLLFRRRPDDEPPDEKPLRGGKSRVG